jgi:hypothetical protein
VASNKALHLTVIPLCSIAAGELGRYATVDLKSKVLAVCEAVSNMVETGEAGPSGTASDVVRLERIGKT